MPDANALSILEAWKNVKLEGFLNDLQAQTGTIADAQKEALLARKKLADRTREFKRQAPETQLEGIRGLLKSYQSQIDALTTRAKQAETIVLDAHARLGQVRDPSPLLDVLREQISEAQDGAELRKKYAHLWTERNELEQRYTESEARAVTLSEQAVQASTHAEQMIADAVAAATRRAAEKQESLERELVATQNHLTELRASHQQLTQQLLAPRASNQDSQHMESVLIDLQRANERAIQAEQRMAFLRDETEKAQASATNSFSRRIAALEQRMQQQVQAHSQQVKALELARQAAQEEAAKQNDAQLQRLNAALDESAQMRKVLEQRSDYDEIKRELDVLRAVEFAGDEAMSDAVEDNASSLETHLVRRNHKLQDEVATLRATLADTKRSADSLREDLSGQLQRVSELSAANAKLEKDLSDFSPNGPVQSDMKDLLPIITGQRDRFRSRNAQLEESMRQQNQVISELRTEVKRLQTDNVSMYEKVRYLQGYSQHQRTDSTYPTYKPVEAEEAYRVTYEASIHPFEAFRGRVCEPVFFRLLFSNY